MPCNAILLLQAASATLPPLYPTITFDAVVGDAQSREDEYAGRNTLLLLVHLTTFDLLLSLKTDVSWTSATFIWNNFYFKATVNIVQMHLLIYLLQYVAAPV